MITYGENMPENVASTGTLFTKSGIQEESASPAIWLTHIVRPINGISVKEQALPV
jgi:hypothetical protein